MPNSVTLPKFQFDLNIDKYDPEPEVGGFPHWSPPQFDLLSVATSAARVLLTLPQPVLSSLHEIKISFSQPERYLPRLIVHGVFDKRFGVARVVDASTIGLTGEEPQQEDEIAKLLEGFLFDHQRVIKETIDSVERRAEELTSAIVSRE